MRTALMIIALILKQALLGDAVTVGSGNGFKMFCAGWMIFCILADLRDLMRKIKE